MLFRIHEFYYHQLKNAPREDAFTQKVKGSWVSMSSDEFVQKSKKLSLGLLQLGLQKGDRVAVIANNRTEWHLTDLAVQQLGVINVPIYTNITESDYEYILNDCGAKYVFVSDEEIAQKISNIKSKVTSLKDIYTFNDVPSHKHYSELLLSEIDEVKLQEAQNTIHEDDVATLIYTSGTTGNPKGVMLTHKNLVSNVLACIPRLPVGDNQRAISFLPLCHVFERMIDYVFIYRSISIYYAESMDTIADNLKEIKPHIFGTVPRLLEKVYDKIIAKGNDLSGIKKGMFFWALDLGLKYDPNKNQGAWYNFQLNLANKLIFSKWREALGGEVLALASGGAALQPRLARVYNAARIPVLEGYGLSETSPVIAVNGLQPENMMIGTVGKPLENLDVKIADDGEIIVKGPSVMKGYFNKPDLTAEVIDDEGYFHTGDIGEIVDGKFLKITDRKKEIFKTSGGKYIAPQIMENKFKESRFIEQVMVIGEGEKMPAALIQPEFIFLKSWCERKGIQYTTNEEMICNERVVARIGKEVTRINESFANYEQVKKFELVPAQWSVDTGELTPTLKLKRKGILTKYDTLCKKIYS